MPTDFVLYRSRSSALVTPRMLTQIIMKSLPNNARDGLTGFLHAEQDYFVQYLEGPKQGLMRRLARILDDARHEDITFLGEGQTEKRLFPSWEMGVLESPVVPRSSGQPYAEWARGLQELTRDELLQALAEQGGQIRRVGIERLDVA